VGEASVNILKRAWQWLDDRTGLSENLGPLLKHPVPPGVGWGYVFGSATLLAFVIQVVSGIALSTAYVSSTAHAYQSLQFITHQAFLGRILRGMHYWGASAMILLIGIHMIRVFLTGAYKFPREMSWLTGVALVGLTLLMGFTGQLLRWDQNAVWSVFVAAEQAGRVPVIGTAISHFIIAGETIGAATLSRFFAFHVFFIPALIFAFLGLHLYLVIRNGISEPPQPGRVVDPQSYREWYRALVEQHGIPFWPEVAWRDVVFGIGVIAGVVLLAWIVGPPHLDKPPDPTIIEAYPRPDWYLLWYFAVLALIPAGLENYVIVLGPGLVGVTLILLPFAFNRGERSLLRRPWAVAVVLLIVMMIGTLWVAGERAPWSPDFTAQPLSAQVVGATSGPVHEGGRLFHAKGCEFCHTIAGRGGRRGPDLTNVADRLTTQQMTLRILNGATNMPAFAGILKPKELDDLVAFLRTRKTFLTGRENSGPTQSGTASPQ
jgi:ubiquinol-cytochrome c reductase cytochrome b subunit